MKINRSPNRLEKLIQAEIKKECRPRKVWFWGSECKIEPAFVDTGRGDRKQLAWVQSIDCRPDYYVLRIDSNEDVEAEGYNWDELLLCPIEETFGSRSSYEEVIVEDKYMYKYWGEDELYPESEIAWPMMSWGGGSWGVIKNFGNPLKQ